MNGSESVSILRAVEGRVNTALIIQMEWADFAVSGHRVLHLPCWRAGVRLCVRRLASGVSQAYLRHPAISYIFGEVTGIATST